MPDNPYAAGRATAGHAYSGYGVPGGHYPPHRGSVVLTLGILGIVLCFILGIFAWVMGSGDLQKMRAGQMDPSGYGTTQAGMICGMIATILAGIGFVVWILLVISLAAA